MLKNIYSKCFQILGKQVWKKIISPCAPNIEYANFPELLANESCNFNLPPYICDLARLEQSLWEIKSKPVSIPAHIFKLTTNPNLKLLQLSWKLLDKGGKERYSLNKNPVSEKEWILIWRKNTQEKVLIQKATPADLFALKVVIDNIKLQDAATANQVSIDVVNQLIRQAIKKGILLSPTPLIQRDPVFVSKDPPPDEKYLLASVFSIQWHITNACDLNCKHCYDRSHRSTLRLNTALAILNDLYDFCKQRFVKGHVSFTGGNPFLYSRFTDLYHAAAEREFEISILGNPTSQEQTETLLAIQKPQFIQVSLEGLKAYNDHIRGRGHYNRVINYLKILKELDIPSSVMLTLTKDNINQVLPLAEQLQGFADAFTFNRLSRVGQGAALELPDQGTYTKFLIEYNNAAKQNPILHYKDNLLNLVRNKQREKLFGGCTGYGCGAAFNFITILPDGEVHACRKFPSPIGNIFNQTIANIYNSDTTQEYRKGCRECDGCNIRHVCGGCLAISHSLGQNIFSQKDPYCQKT